MNFRLDFGIRHWFSGERANTGEHGFEFGSGLAARFILNPSLYKYANQLASFRGRERKCFSGDFVEQNGSWL